MAVDVIHPGALCTVQDLGRVGFAAQGYPECGACDKYSMRLANLLCGNLEDPCLAVLECTLSGATLQFDRETVVALAGAEMSATLDGIPCAMNAPVYAPAGSRLEMGPFSRGLRGYVAVYGGFDVPIVLGSRSTDLKSRIGGMEGRAVRTGDSLPVPPCPDARQICSKLAHRARGLEAWAFHPASPTAWLDGEAIPILRAVPGPQHDAFTARGLASFESSLYALATDSNRMATRLLGEKIESIGGMDILSDGILEGCVQISSDGQPIVMLADHQTIGGYAKIACVLPCDLPALAQCRPGERVRFRFVRREEGIEAAIRERERLKYIQTTLRGK